MRRPIALVGIAASLLVAAPAAAATMEELVAQTWPNSDLALQARTGTCDMANRVQSALGTHYGLIGFTWEDAQRPIYIPLVPDAPREAVEAIVEDCGVGDRTRYVEAQHSVADVEAARAVVTRAIADAFGAYIQSGSGIGFEAERLTLYVDVFPGTPDAQLQAVQDVATAATDVPVIVEVGGVTVPQAVPPMQSRAIAPAAVQAAPAVESAPAPTVKAASLGCSPAVRRRAAALRRALAASAPRGARVRRSAGCGPVRITARGRKAKAWARSVVRRYGRARVTAR